MRSQARTNKARADGDKQGGSLDAMLDQDYEDRLARARALELRWGVSGVVGAFLMFNIGYWWRDKLPERS